jgi:alkanesulfonate monooxygenase SsuD/methylene tetrahydromethanopterin reductase-like flavin-dependent oxidoreductase (luciferase family)
VAPALRRAGRLADGWICSSQQDLARIGACVGIVGDGSREAGRDPENERILVRFVPDLDDDPGPQLRPFQGTREQVLDDLAALRGQGVTAVFFDLNFSPRVNFAEVDVGAALPYAVPAVYVIDDDDYIGVPVDTVKPKSSTRLQRDRRDRR